MSQIPAIKLIQYGTKPLLSANNGVGACCLQLIAPFSVQSGNGNFLCNDKVSALKQQQLCLPNQTQLQRINTGCLTHHQHIISSTWLQHASKRLVHVDSKQDAAADIDKDIKENLEKIRVGDFQKTKVTNPEELQHFRAKKEDVLNSMGEPGKAIPMGAQSLPHPIWTQDEVHSVEVTHKEPEGIVDRMAFFSVKLLRTAFDIMSGFNRKIRSENVWINRICFLETVAGVPGMVAAMTRHLHSLRRMRRDHGWIHTLLEEAENERMHLMTALQLKQPGLLFRWSVVGAQGVMVTFFSLAYLVSPRYCHRFVGYLEEEAVITYTKCLQDIESGPMQHWKTQAAPDVAKRYWKLAPDSTMKDVILAIRADEAHHRVVNHTLSSMKSDDYNPYKPGQ